MTNPRRLIDDGLDDFERNLLAAGRRDAMSPSSRARIFAGLGLSALIPGTAVAAGVKGAAKGTLFGLAGATGVKVAIGGAVGALAIWSSVALLSGSGDKPNAALETPVRVAEVSLAEPVTRAPAPVVNETTSAEDQVAEEPQQEQSVSRRTPAGTKQSSDDLGRELESLDEARAALRSGDAARCLELLREHTRKFPRQRMAVEASVLRIEALAASGNREAARKAGREFLARHPKGPYAQRVSSLIDGDRGEGDRNMRE
jgi:hypothetical protein